MNTLILCIKKAWPTSLKTTLWLLKLMLPISLAVRLLQFYGVIEWIAQYLDVVFLSIGVPGYGAVAFLTGAFVTTYAGIAVMLSMALTLREATIIAVMMCICHALFMESAVVKKTGSSFWGMAVLRFLLAFVCGFYLNMVLPEMNASFVEILSEETYATLTTVLESWLISSLKMSLMVAALVLVLMVIQRLLEAYNVMRKVSKWLAPLMRFFGLPDNASYMWIVGNVLGISYGSAVMIDLEEQGQITSDEANDVNYHLVMNHSMLEDTCVFASFGISAFWVLSTRILFALVVVWSRRLILLLIRKIN